MRLKRGCPFTIAWLHNGFLHRILSDTGKPLLRVPCAPRRRILIKRGARRPNPKGAGAPFCVNLLRNPVFLPFRKKAVCK